MAGPAAVISRRVRAIWPANQFLGLPPLLGRYFVTTDEVSRHGSQLT
jgi:hypothetical protein